MSGSKLSDASLPPIAAAPQPEPADEPLGLTVHSMPMPQSLNGDAQRTARGRRMMFILLLICAAPMIASYFTYYVIRPEGRKNYGELIEPQRPMPALAAAALDGSPGTLTDLKGQWLLVSVAGSQCDADCQKHLYLQRQLRESVGREKDRLDWVWLVTDAQTPPAALMPALQQAQVRRVDGTALAQWLTPAAGHAMVDHIYVVDPQGNWMMRFPAPMDAGGAAKAKKDLERLLRASASWDEPGRPGKP